MIPNQYYRSPIVQALLERATNPNIGPVYSIGHGLALAGTQILNAVMAKQFAKKEQEEDEANTNAMIDALVNLGNGSWDAYKDKETLKSLNSKDNSSSENYIPATPAAPVQPLKTGDVNDYLSNPPSVEVKADGTVAPRVAPTTQSLGQGTPRETLVQAYDALQAARPSTPSVNPSVPRRLADVARAAVPVTPPLAVPPASLAGGDVLPEGAPNVGVGTDGNIMSLTAPAPVVPPVGQPSAQPSRSLVEAAMTRQPTAAPTTLVDSAVSNNPTMQRLTQFAGVLRQMPQSQFKTALAQNFLSSAIENMFAEPQSNQIIAGEDAVQLGFAPGTVLSKSNGELKVLQQGQSISNQDTTESRNAIAYASLFGDPGTKPFQDAQIRYWQAKTGLGSEISSTKSKEQSNKTVKELQTDFRKLAPEYNARLNLTDTAVSYALMNNRQGDMGLKRLFTIALTPNLSSRSSAEDIDAAFEGLDDYWSTFKSWFSKGELTPEKRRDVLEAIFSANQPYQDQYKDLIAQFTNQAIENGVNPADIIPDSMAVGWELYKDPNSQKSKVRKKSLRPTVVDYRTQ